MSGSKTALSPDIIAFMGVLGANADIACRKAYPYMQTMALESFEDVFIAVEQGKARIGMIPIENSEAGRVAEIHNLLPKHNVYIVSEYFLRVEHCLVAAKGTKLDEIKEVISHPQALMQCQKWLRDRHITPIAFSNTAVAAAEIAHNQSTIRAAISSRLAADLYGLDILAAAIEDSANNTTLFVAIAKEPIDPEQEDVVTSVVFTARNIPAALYKALGGFATNGVNLTKIESYIPSGVSAMAQFFISFEGNPRQRSVQLALEELGFFCKKVRVLGVYPAAPERRMATHVD